MTISDILNRRVRARHDEEEEVYSEVSDGAEDVSQDELEEDESDPEDLQSQVNLDLDDEQKTRTDILLNLVERVR